MIEVDFCPAIFVCTFTFLNVSLHMHIKLYRYCCAYYRNRPTIFEACLFCCYIVMLYYRMTILSTLNFRPTFTVKQNCYLICPTAL